jgi:hypothetical protein
MKIHRMLCVAPCLTLTHGGWCKHTQRSTRRLRYRYRLPRCLFTGTRRLATDDTTNGIVFDSVTGDPISVISVSL